MLNLVILVVLCSTGNLVTALNNVIVTISYPGLISAQRNSFQHIWSYVVGIVDGSQKSLAFSSCPCVPPFNSNQDSSIGLNCSCESGNNGETHNSDTYNMTNLLWDGADYPTGS